MTDRLDYGGSLSFAEAEYYADLDDGCGEWCEDCNTIWPDEDACD